MDSHRIGVISDTHGLMRPEALAALQGSGLIVHAGDIGSSRILTDLRAIAPVVAVRGNIDREDWALALAERESIEWAGMTLHVIHDFQELDFDPAAAGVMAVISGHSHRPAIRHVNGVLLLNPGSAGPRRFNLPVSVALMDVRDGRVEARIIDLKL